MGYSIQKMEYSIQKMTISTTNIYNKMKVFYGYEGKDVPEPDTEHYNYIITPWTSPYPIPKRNAPPLVGTQPIPIKRAEPVTPDLHPEHDRELPRGKRKYVDDW